MALTKRWQWEINSEDIYQRLKNFLRVKKCYWLKNSWCWALDILHNWLKAPEHRGVMVEEQFRDAAVPFFAQVQLTPLQASLQWGWGEHMTATLLWLKVFGRWAKTHPLYWFGSKAPGSDRSLLPWRPGSRRRAGTDAGNWKLAALRGNDLCQGDTHRVDPRPREVCGDFPSYWDLC